MSTKSIHSATRRGGRMTEIGVFVAALLGTVLLWEALYLTSQPAEAVQQPAALPRAESLTSPREPRLSNDAPPGSASKHKAARPDNVLYEQLDYPSAMAITSQNFEPVSDTYDAQFADDFIVPAGQTWTIDTVEVYGEYLGSGPAQSVNVFIYADQSLMPGSPVLSDTNLVYSGGLDYGDLVITLNPPAILPAGTYWLSVQANQDFLTHGQWFWRGRDALSNHTAAWRSPGGAFRRGEPCTQWASFRCSCFTGPPIADATFRLSGTSSATPTPGATGTTPPSRTPRPQTETSTTLPGIPSPVLTLMPPLGSTTPTGTSTPVPACSLAWRASGGPAWPLTSELMGVDAASSSDVWAVGKSYYYMGSAVISHWDGTAWGIVPAPPVTGTFAALNDVALVTANDVWASGSYQSNDYGNKRTLVEHFDGTAWSIVASPNPGDPYQDNELRGLAVVAANDVWAVGYYGGYSGPSTLILHWTGAAWSVVPSPNPGTYTNDLYAISAASANDLWAVGTYGSRYDDMQLLVEHWNGIEWNVVPIPSYQGALYDITVLPGGEIWASGIARYECVERPLVLHYTSSSWQAFHPFSPPYNYHLTGLAVAADNDVWVVGNSGPPFLQTTVIGHWNGTEWSIADHPIMDDQLNRLNGVAALNWGDIWAVGTFFDDTISEIEPLILHYNDPCGLPTGTPTPSPSPTGSPTLTGTDTLTPTYMPTSTSTGIPTSVATPCSLQFSDVLPGSVFYPYVHCLACRGILGGYSDGTFKPNNNVTRGQLSKIVSNAAGFNDAQSAQRFQDVAVGSTFFQYIGRLASRGYMSGYLCGGPGEQCVPPANLPYFRPNNKASRGQLTKIVSNAAGFQDSIPTSVQTFTDVPPSYTFWVYVERLLMNRPGVMGGYACGGANEPCDPQQRPYFRPGSNVTRGQNSKIVANTFFPGCQTP